MATGSSLFGTRLKRQGSISRGEKFAFLATFTTSFCSAYDYVIPARGVGNVKTDVSIVPPTGCYARISPRSGLAIRHGICVGAGVVDADYRGNVGVVLFNHSDQDFRVERGDRIAQLICERISYPTLVRVSTLGQTERGSAGFGSTGMK